MVGNTPASIAAPYASEIISTFDIDKPEVLSTLFRARGDQGAGYFGMIKAMGFEMPVAQDNYKHYEEDWIHESFRSRAAVGAPGAGNSIDITISTADLDTDNNFYPRKDDQVMFANGVTGIITVVDTTTPADPVLTIEPNDATEDIGAIALDEVIIIFSGASSEGSGQPTGAVTGTFTYDNDLQIIKETLTATGTEMTNQKWFTQLSIPNPKGGGSIPAYYLKGQKDVDYRMALKMDGALLFGKRTTNTDAIDPDTNRQYKTTEGLIPYVERVGNIQDHVPGTFSVQTFNTIGKKLDKEFAANYICSLLGINLDHEIEDVLVDYLKNTDVSYTTKKIANDKFRENEGLAASMNFTYLTKGGRTFAFKRLPQLSHDKLYGATGYNRADLGVMIPMATKKDKLSKKELPTFGMRYKQLGQYNRMMEVWNVSGAGPGLKVIPDDLHNHYQRTHCGAHHMAGNQMVLIDPQ